MESENNAPMPAVMRFAIACYIAAMTIALIGAMIAAWPPAPPADRTLFLIAALAGALGSYIHLSSSFISYAGKHDLQSSWAAWYFLRPGVGAALAVTVYLAVRGGIVGDGGQASSAINVHGIAAVSALSGMFSKQATEKLREMFEQFCGSARESSQNPSIR